MTKKEKKELEGIAELLVYQENIGEAIDRLDKVIDGHVINKQAQQIKDLESAVFGQNMYLSQLGKDIRDGLERIENGTFKLSPQ